MGTCWLRGLVVDWLIAKVQAKAEPNVPKSRGGETLALLKC